MLLGVWADQAGVFLAWLCAITTVVFAVPITFFPLRWARLMRWQIPAETQLTVYFGRCLGLFILILEGLMARAAWSGEGRVWVFEQLAAKIHRQLRLRRNLPTHQARPAQRKKRNRHGKHHRGDGAQPRQKHTGLIGPNAQQHEDDLVNK
jgi:hypothetical protein